MVLKLEGVHKVKLHSVGFFRRTGRASADDAIGRSIFVGQPVNLR